jgi:hypothetical protein
LINKGVRIAFLILLVGLLAYGAWNLRDFGEPGEEVDEDVTLYNAASNTTENVDRTAMDEFVITHSQSGKSPDEEDLENGPSANNAVTAVVFDYRGFDTIGEATVLFAAVSGVLVTIRVALPVKDKKKGGDE